MTALNQLNQLALLNGIAEIDGTINQFESAFGYDPSFQYCLLTGKPIGIVNSAEFGELLGMLPSEGKLTDLRLRVLASMRRSMKWNKDAIANLPLMRRSHPIETMSYLLNQLFQAPKNGKSHWDVELENRIFVYSMIEEWHTTYGRSLATVSNSAWDAIMHMLIELNAKFNLAEEIAPFTAADFLSLPIESFLQTIAERLAPWHKRRVEFHYRQELQAIYHAANPGAKRAYYESFMEQKPQPVRVAKVVKPVSAKKATENLLNDIFDSIIALDPTILDEGKPVTPVPVVKATPKAFTFGALVKKGQN